MFSDNQKISQRQMTRLLVYDMLGISTLLLPSALARLLGRDGIFAILFALALALLAVRVMQHMFKGKNVKNSTHAAKTGPVSSMRLLYGIEGICVAGFALYHLSTLLLKELLVGEQYWLIALILLLLGGYGIYQGIEGRARVYELLYWILMVPLLIMLLLAAKDVNVDYWTPIATCGIWELFLGICVVLLFYMMIVFALFLMPYLTEGTSVAKGCRKSLIQVAAINSAVYLITLGVFGEAALAELRYPVITLLSMVKLPGGFFERQDAFMVGIWFFTVYALINTGMFYASDMMKTRKQRQLQKPCGKMSILFTMVLVYIEAMLFYLVSNVYRWFILLQLVVVLPLTIILLILLVCNRRKGVRENEEHKKS